MRAQIFNPIGVVHGLFPVFSGNKRVARAKAVFCDKKRQAISVIELVHHNAKPLRVDLPAPFSRRQIGIVHTRNQISDSARHVFRVSRSAGADIIAEGYKIDRIFQEFLVPRPQFSRVQFTPDLLPGDITGINVYDRQKNEFTLRKGPVFTNILLADELNRATPRTQAGLLECMEERQVTIEGVSYTPGEPFFVIATENPIESAGVFPLPEAQLDRFLIKLSMNLPTKEEELRILELYMEEDPLKSLTAVVSLEELLAARAEAAKIFVHPCIREYMVQIAEATRRADGILAGVSPRGTLGLLRCVKVYAYLQGRSYVIPDDVRTLAVPVLAHRLVCSFGSDTGSAAGRMENILSTVPVPTERFEP